MQTTKNKITPKHFICFYYQEGIKEKKTVVIFFFVYIVASLTGFFGQKKVPRRLREKCAQLSCAQDTCIPSSKGQEKCASLTGSFRFFSTPLKEKGQRTGHNP